MRALDKKLVRDLLRMKGQAIAIGLIIACGVASFVTVLTAYRGLKGTRDAYYRDYRMADVFAPVKRAPVTIAGRLEQIPGVRRVRPRIVFEVTIDLPDVREPAFGRILSLPDERERLISDIHMVKGGWFTGDGDRQVIVGNEFAKKRGLGVGDNLRVIMNDKKEALSVVGTALSPEYVYMIRGAGEVLPDPEHFTVLWLSTSFAESVFDMKEAANDFLALLDPDAREQDVLDAFDRELDRYGGLMAYSRDDQLSNRFLSDEIEGLKGSATMTPTIFLGVAAFVLHMLLGRLVRTQRTQIAVLRAFGYTTGQVAWHYLKLSLGIGVVGAIAGTAVGVWMAKALLGLYTEFYQFPMLRFRIEPAVIGMGVAVSLFFSSLGAFSAARRAAGLKPAEGLRPEAPGVFRKTFVEGWRWLWRQIGFVWRMVVRNVLRTKKRAAFTMGGVGLSTSIIFLAVFSIDSMDELVQYQERYMDREDLRVTFNRERGISAVYEVRSLPGVRQAEPELVVAATLAHGHRKKRIGIYGLQAGGSLRGLVDKDLGPVPRPTNGILLTRKLGEILGVDRGDELEVRVLTGKRQSFTAPVEGLVDEYLGASAYADRITLSGWIDEEDALNSVRILADDDAMGDLSHTLKNLPAVEGVSIRAQSIEVFKETLVKSMNAMTGVLVLFAGIISFGVIYNSSRIALAERERTLASLRVLGFTRAEVAKVLLRENYLLSFLGIAPGLALGVGFCWLLARNYDTDLFRFPFVIRPESLLATALAVLVFTVIANTFIRRRVRRLDLVEVLKSRE